MLFVVRTMLLFAPFATAWLSAQSSAPLFLVERSTNSNVVHYDANLTADGDIDSHDPVSVYWTIGAADGPRERLGFFERRAWAADVETKSEGRYILRVVSQKSIPIEFYREPGGKVRAEVSISGERAYLHRIYTKITGPLLLPKVEYIELFGVNLVSGLDANEKIIP